MENTLFPYDLEAVPHNLAVEQIVTILNQRTQNTEKEFFRILVCFFLSKLASSMRVSIDTEDRGNIPINNYTVALAPSGYSKGHSVNVLETEIFALFKERFEQHTIPEVSEQALRKLSIKRSVQKGTDEAEEHEKIVKEFETSGIIPFTFDSGSVPAVKQLRHTLLMATIGAVNLQIDEIASNLMGSTELLNAYLELYDQGLIKQKLTKNTSESIRREELPGKTPSNMLLFGTPTKLYDGSSIENHFLDFLEIGYARRCFFALGQINNKDITKTAEQIYDELCAVNSGSSISYWANYLQKLADPRFHEWKISLEREEGIRLLSYKLFCEQRAEEIPDTDQIGKAEMSHRYFKALKLAGTFAFIEMESSILETHLMQAIKVTEESGKSFKLLRNRDKAYVRLAKYIANVQTPLTHADLVEALPYYKGTATARHDLMTFAIAWGYKKHIIIRRKEVEGIELFTGEALLPTNLDELVCSYSYHYANDYEPVKIGFSELPTLTTTANEDQRLQWANHHFKSDHRNEANAIEGFNLAVIDVDGGVSASLVHTLFKGYVHFIHTTKRSTDEDNRFRLILPLSHVLKLDADDYREFMQAIIEWLPFQVDEQTNQRSRKWEAYENAQIYENDQGELLDVLQFIPHTTKYEQAQTARQKVTNMDALERWFYESVDKVGRNNQILKYALALFDAGVSHTDIRSHVNSFNSKLPNPLSQTEIDTTVFVTLAKKFI